MSLGKGVKFVTLITLVASLALLPACGGGGGSGSSSGSTPVVDDGNDSTPAVTSGIALPTEVSAVSTSLNAGTASFAGNIRALAVAVNDMPANSDYVKAKPAKYVDEPVLEVFGIIETILKAMAQTNYADPENVGSGPYNSVVAWYEEEDGQTVKEMEEWIVESVMVDDVNVVKVWINDPEDPVKVLVNILVAPTQDTDGNYVDYGEWTISAAMETGNFFADAVVVDGETRLRLSEDFTMSESIDDGEAIEITEQTKAVMIKSPASGFGKALVADFGYCWDYDYATETSPCADPSFSGILPQTNVQYAYDTKMLSLAIDENNDGAADQSIYKDRTDPAEIAYRYGLFDAETGENVEKSKEFGFSVSYDSGNSVTNGYYGAWQGRHQLWLSTMEGEGLPNGSIVTEEVWDDSTPREFTTEVFNGVLTKRNMVAGQLAQIQDIPVEIWLSENYDLRFDDSLDNGAGGWQKCSYQAQGIDEQGNEIWGSTCEETAFDMSKLYTDPENGSKDVFVNGQLCTSYSSSEGSTGCEYPELAVEQDGTLTYQDGTPVSPIHGDTIWANVNGSAYILYNGTEWAEKQLIDFNEETWTPVFADAENDVPFEFPTGREYYINTKGTNYVVKKVDASSYEVNMEVQSIVRPDNYEDMLSGVTYFAYEWENSEERSTFVFDPVAMTLKYETVGSAESNSGVQPGDTVEIGQWGLAAYDSSGMIIMVDQQHSLQFNWEYAGQDNLEGRVTYLVDNATNEYVFLDDPVMLDPIQIDGQTYSLQFDGWMHGLPDMHWELQKNDYVLTDAIRDKIVNIPVGTLVTDSSVSPSEEYYVKPLEIGVILPSYGTVPVGAPNPAAADDLVLDFTPPEAGDIGAMPTDVITKYVEGKSVE